VSRREGVVAALGLAGAALCGGVAQTFLWRWGADSLAAVLGSQFTWVLLTFAVSWAAARGRVGTGVAAGALTGLALIVSYYATQWLADGRHAALSQFTGTGGTAWTLAAVGGGAAMGVFGALAGRDAEQSPRLKALGISTPAVIVGAGAPLWLLYFEGSLGAARLLPAVVVFVAAGAALLLAAVRSCGLGPSLQGLVVSLGFAAAALGALMFLQTQGWLYLTF